MCFTLGRFFQHLLILGAGGIGGGAELIFKRESSVMEKEIAEKCYMKKIFFQVFNFNQQILRNWTM
jgi:hypothetical protein